MKNIGKYLLLGFMFCVMVVILQIIASLVQERKSYRNTAVESITRSNGGVQNIVTPYASRNCTVHTVFVDPEDGKTKKSINSQDDQFFAQQVTGSFDAQINPLKRGIYTVNAYTLKVTFTADFEPIAFPKSKGTCDTPRIQLPISNMAGLQNLSITVNGSPVVTGNLEGGTGVFFQLSPEISSKPLKLEAKMSLKGSEALSFIPLAHTSRIDISSNWPHPSFAGRNLPTDRRVTAQGFNASWSAQTAVDASSMNIKDLHGSSPSAANVIAFIDPLDVYALSYRATNYGFIFLALTFLAFGLLEWQGGARVHLLQYGLVAAAIVIFFLLLLSTAEHIGFAKGYALASAACVTLLAYYSTYILGSWRKGFGFGVLMATMYATLFTLLSLAETALLVGSVLLFAILVLVMVMTRKMSSPANPD